MWLDGGGIITSTVQLKNHMDQEYKDKVTRNLYEAIWTFINSIDESETDQEKELAKVIFNATQYPSLVSREIDELRSQAEIKKVRIKKVNTDYPSDLEDLDREEYMQEKMANDDAGLN